jgi:hypothetical protein
VLKSGPLLSYQHVMPTVLIPRSLSTYFGFSTCVTEIAFFGLPFTLHIDLVPSAVFTFDFGNSLAYLMSFTGSFSSQNSNRSWPAFHLQVWCQKNSLTQILQSPLDSFGNHLWFREVHAVAALLCLQKMALGRQLEEIFLHRNFFLLPRLK